MGQRGRQRTDDSAPDPSQTTTSAQHIFIVGQHRNQRARTYTAVIALIIAAALCHNRDAVHSHLRLDIAAVIQHLKL